MCFREISLGCFKKGLSNIVQINVMYNIQPEHSQLELCAEIKHDDSLNPLNEYSVIDNLVNIVGGHELRTPLSIIQGFTELLENYEENPEMRKYMFESIKDSIKRINNLSTRIGIWHRLQAGCNFKMEHMTVQKSFVYELIDEVSNNDIKSLISISATSDAYLILANRVLVSTVFTELLDNAVKFSEKNARIEIDMYVAENNFNFAVTNVSSKTNFSEILEYKAFTQFNRNLYEQQGLGLGIDISAMALKTMNGHLLVETHTPTSRGCQALTFIAQLPIDVQV